MTKRPSDLDFSKIERSNKGPAKLTTTPTKFRPRQRQSIATNVFVRRPKAPPMAIFEAPHGTLSDCHGRHYVLCQHPLRRAIERQHAHYRPTRTLQTSWTVRGVMPPLYRWRPRQLAVQTSAHCSLFGFKALTLHTWLRAEIIVNVNDGSDRWLHTLYGR